MARTKDFDENEVLDKAIDLFWLKGYNATSMQDLVDGLGISRSSLYDTFVDKHTLYIKALKQYQSTSSASLCAIISDHKPAKETLKQLLEYIISGLLDDQKQKGCFMVNAEVEVAPHDQAVNEMICRNDHEMEDAFYHVIKKGQEQGEITSGQDARALSRFILNTVKGIRVTAKSTSDKAVFDDIIKMAVAVLDQ